LGGKTIVEKKKGNFFKGGRSGKINNIESSINQNPLLSIHIRDTGICYLYSPKSNIFNIQYFIHLSGSSMAIPESPQEFKDPL
jgi:hypothetical protein